MRKALISLLIIMLLAGCSTTPNTDELAVAIPTDPDNFHPHQSVAAATAEIAFNIFEGLVKAAPDGSIIPALATEWEISTDGRQYTFTLREGVKFHNGRELTADDVVYCLNRLRDPEISPKSRDYTDVESIYADGNKVIASLTKPNAVFLALLTELGAAVYPREAEDQLTNKPIGTGPYLLENWEPNNSLTLSKFHDYWNPQLPKIDKVILKIIPEPSTMVNSLLTGHVDLVPRLEPDYLHQVENQPNLQIIDSPMNLVQLMAINNSVPPFDDIRVRQALNYAVNREEIIQGAGWGKGTAIGSNLTPAMGPWYKDLTGQYPYDPEKAKELLAEAGYPQGFSATLHLPAPYPLHRNAGEIIADQLEDVGIKLKIEVIEWGTWLEQVNTNRDYQLTVVGFTGRIDPHTMLNRYQSQSGRNISYFNNPEYDMLLVQGLEETDLAARVEIYQQLQTILAEEASNVYIMDPSQIAAMNKNIQGWVNYPVYVLDLARLEKVK